MSRNLTLLLARILFAALFVPAGFQTLGNISGSTGYFAGLGLPAPEIMAWGVGLFELISGLLVLIGFQTRIASLALALFCLSAAFLGHYGQGAGDPVLAFMHQQMLMKDIAIAGGFLALAMAGSGAFSVDSWHGLRAT
jgi:putative oxidoreductase